MNPSNCGLCEFRRCPFQDGQHTSTFENMLTFMAKQVSKVPILRWHRLISVCKTLNVYRHICGECRTRKNVRKLTFLVYDTHPPLFILECFCNQKKEIRVKECQAFSFHPWTSIVPTIQECCQRTMREWKEKKDEENCCV